MSHKTVRVKFKNVIYKVDKTMSECLKALWAKGIYTRYSCEGYDKEAYIMFNDPQSASKFVGIIGRNTYLAADAWAYSCGEKCKCGKSVLVHYGWRWEIVPDLDDHTKGNRGMRITVFFPKIHIPRITKLFRYGSEIL